MADNSKIYPITVPLPPLSRAAEVDELLVGAIDLHCHSGPAAMPRILDHHEELMDAAAAKFRAVLFSWQLVPGSCAQRASRSVPYGNLPPPRDADLLRDAGSRAIAVNTYVRRKT